METEPRRSGVTRGETAVLALLVFLAFAVRAYFLIQHPIVYHYDAVTRLGLYDVLAVRRWLPIPQIFIMVHDWIGFPLLAFSWICALWSLAAVGLAWAFWRRLVGSPVAFALAVLFAFSPPFLLAGVNPYQEAFFFTFLFGGILLLEARLDAADRITRTPKTGAKSGARRLLLGALLLGLAGLCRFEAWALALFLIGRVAWRETRTAAPLGSRLLGGLRRALIPLAVAYALPALWLIYISVAAGEGGRGSVDTMIYLPASPSAGGETGSAANPVVAYAREFARQAAQILNPRGHLAALTPWPLAAVGLLGFPLLIPPLRRGGRAAPFYIALIIPVLAVEAWAGRFFPLAPRVFLTVFVFWLPLLGLVLSAPARWLGRPGAERVRSAGIVLTLLLAVAVSATGAAHSLRRFAASAGRVQQHAVFAGAPHAAADIRRHAREREGDPAPAHVVAAHEREALALRIYLHGSDVPVTWIPPGVEDSARREVTPPAYWIVRDAPAEERRARDNGVILRDDPAWFILFLPPSASPSRTE
ncbi:MAG: hypothetical protein GF355_12530 [Candidatus Eisenbacteria bacterium]|nr:hypothetical protein [Candidatus Eisenbacteria bacterium]